LKSTDVANSQTVAQSRQSVQAAQATLAADQASLQSAEVADSQALTQAEASVQAAQANLTSDQAGVKSAEVADSQALTQAQQAVQSDRASLATDTSTLSSDEATLSAAEQKETADCRGNASASVNEPSSSSPPGSPSGSATPCAADQAAVASDQAVVNADRQKVSADQSAVTGAQGNVASTKTKNTQTVQQLDAKLTADQQAQTAAGGNVASTKTKNTQTVQQLDAKLTADHQAVSSAQVNVASTKTKNTQTLQQVQAKVAADQQALSAAEGNVGATEVKDTQTAQQAAAQVAAARLTVSQDKATLSTDEQEADVAGQSSTYSELPAVGQVVSRGKELFAIGGQPVVLLYGSVTPWRAFAPGMTPGEDVAQLNANLAALGYENGLQGDNFTATTESAVKRLQAALGISPSGQLPVGSVDFQPGAVRVTGVTPNLGATVAPGQPVLAVTLLSRQIQVALDSSLQSDVKVGDVVSIVMPNNATLPGTVTFVGTVATVPSANSGGGSPTINVDIAPNDPTATGTLDQLPVEVWITEGTADNVLVLPVDALLALAGGGYAVEAVGAEGVRHLEGVTLGLFDDADGLVQVSGPGLFAGQQVVVPNV
ncbi:MAG TPA: peptidoglycan-binding protein, partial [Acidimicrobiales bacterium]|nr:peptidoglycan-binding protein [Acidimicrobiales bacterium]